VIRCKWDIKESIWGYTLVLNREPRDTWFLKIRNDSLHASLNKDTIEADYEI